MPLTAAERKRQLELLTLQNNAPPDPDLALEGGVAAPKQIARAQTGASSAAPAVVAAVKKDKLKRNRRRSQIITNFQNDAPDDERKRRRL